MATIFKQLEQLKLKALKEAQQITSAEGLSALQDKMSLIDEVYSYCIEGEWLGRSSAAQRLSYYLSHTPKECAQEFNCDVSSVYSSITNYSRKFEDMIGTDFIKLIEEDKISEARVRFYIGINRVTLNSLIYGEAVLRLPAPSTENTYKLTDCANELKFLRICSLAYFQSLKNKVDLDKIAYIRAILDGKVDNMSESRAVLFFFLSEMKADLQATMNKLKEIEEINEGKKI